jgi:hypothetical protein
MSTSLGESEPSNSNILRSVAGSADNSETTPLLPEYASDTANTLFKRRQNVKYYVSLFIRRYLPLLGVVILTFVMLVQAARVNWGQEFFNGTIVNIDDVSFEQFTDDGVSLRVRGNVHINYTLIDHASYRSWALRLGAYPLHSLTVGRSESVLLLKNYNGKVTDKDDEQDYSHAVTAHLPQFDVNVRHNETTHFNLVTNLTDFGNPSLLATIVKRILTQKEIEFKYKTQLRLSKMSIPFGAWPFTIQAVVNPENIGFSDSNLLRLDQLQLKKVSDGLEVSAAVSTFYNLSVSANVPQLMWDMYLAGCDDDEFIYVAQVENSPIQLQPYKLNEMKMYSYLQQLDPAFIQHCTGTNANHTALDQLVQKYLSGDIINLQVRGSAVQKPDTVPDWIAQILPLLHVNLPFRFDRGPDAGDQKLVREVELTNFRLIIPPRNKNPFDGGRDKQPLPKLDAHIRAILQPPEELNLTKDLDLAVDYARGLADLYYRTTSAVRRKFAVVDIRNWLPCTTDTAEDPETGNMRYIVEFDLVGVPMNVTDESTFSEVARQILLKGSAPILLQAQVDADVATPLGNFVFSDIHIEGETLIKA